MNSFPLFQFPYALGLLLLLPLLLWRIHRVKKTRAVVQSSVGHVLARAPTSFRSRMLPLLPILRSVAFVLAVVALARPQKQGAERRDNQVEGIDIMIALDVSTSMEAADFRPNNRLFVAKDVLTDFINQRINDRLGLVVFSGAAYTQAPLTLDYGILKEVVASLRTRVLEDGTAIGDALATSLNRLRDSDAKSKVVVLITDGDNNAGNVSPADAASMAKALNIPVYPILVGRGGRVPFPQGTDIFGQTIWRELEIPVNTELLESMAKETGGKFYRAVDRESLKVGLKQVLDSFEKSKLLESSALQNVQEVFQPWLLGALVALLLEMILAATWLRVFP